MLQTLLVTLREGLEAFLIVGIALGYLLRTGRQALASSVYAGLVVALALSAALGVWLVDLGGLSPMYEGALAAVAAFFVITCTVHVLRMGKHLGAHIRAGMDQAATKSGVGLWFAVFAFIVLMVGREGVEAATMLASLATQSDGQTLLIGGVAGLALAGSIAAAWSRYGQRVNLTLFFRVTSVFMLLFSLQLILYAFNEFSEVEALPFVNNSQFHIAVEPYGPDGDYGAMLSYGLVALPLVFLILGQVSQWLKRKAHT